MTEMNANDLLMAGGTPSAKFETPGTTISGPITAPPEVQQQRDYATGEPKFWDDGRPMQQIRVVLGTDRRDPADPHDDGRRAIYVKGNMLKAVRQAIRAAGARGLEVGGTLTVTYTGDGEAAKRGFNPPKLFTAEYAPPAPGAAANDVLMGGAPAAPAPQAPAAPAAGLSAEQAAALAALTPEQRAALGL